MSRFHIPTCDNGVGKKETQWLERDELDICNVRP